MTVYRIVSKQNYLWSGMGAAILGGRWNSRGLPTIYCATNLALCALEQLVHIKAGGFPTGYFYGRAEIPEALVEEPSLSTSQLLDTEYTREFGDEWLRQGLSGILVVPSAVIPSGEGDHDRNVLLNPNHPDFGKLSLGAPQPYLWDARLFPQ